MKLYEYSILIEGALDSIEQAFIAINNHITEDNPHFLQEDKEFGFRLDTIIFSIDIICQNISKINIDNIKDKEIKAELNRISYLVNTWGYYVGMINAALSLSFTQVDHIVIDTDVKRYLSMIYDNLGDCLNHAKGIKYSDYCYVERGLLKPEEVGYTKDEVGFDIKKNEIASIYEPQAPINKKEY